MNTSPAQSLAGLTLDGWVVDKILPRRAGQTGGNFSVTYLVVGPQGQPGFLKAVDLVQSMGDPTRLQRELKNYEYEDRILKICRDLEMEGVVIALASGIHRAEFHGIEVAIPYLIFEKADGDIRTHEKAQVYNLEWRLTVFQGACVSMQQLHRAEIAHQDIKPSNILIFGDIRAKVADLGRATRRSDPSSFEMPDHAGDRNYYPVELLYRTYHDGNWIRRRLGADMFMMGCLLTHLVSDVSLLTLLFERLDRRFWPEVWKGTYEEVLPHLEMAMDEVLADLKQCLPVSVAELICHMIKSLSHPNCQRRGKPFLFGEKWEGARASEPEEYLRQQYSFEYVVSRVDVIVKKAHAREELNQTRFWQFFKAHKQQ